MSKIGIMQGRLSKQINGKIQAFPWKTWKEEFTIAKNLGFSTIQFIIEDPDHKNNPLLTDHGNSEICEVVSKTGVTIDHICADYFMQNPIIRASSKDLIERIDVLIELIRRSPHMGILGVELPMVDNSSIKTSDEKKSFIKALKEPLALARELNIEIGLETDLNPTAFKRLLEEIDHPSIKANYDIGNSASLGYDTYEEITTIARWISNVHIKDRVFGGTTVPLGAGNANFEKSFSALKEINYTGPYIFQAARGTDDILTAKNNLKFLKKYL